MKIQLIRNATLRLSYGGHTLLVDPFLASKHSLPTFAGRSPNPLVDLPLSPRQALEGVEMVLLSHLHGDHFDQTAQELLPKDLPIFCQPGDQASIAGKGFRDVRPLEMQADWQGITFQRTPGRHGSSPAVLKMMGQVSGFVLQAAGEPRVYLAGDTVWYPQVQAILERWEPQVIVTHSGGAVWAENEKIIMDAEQTLQVCRAAPESTVVAVHLEALDHCMTSRRELRELAAGQGIRAGRLRIPADGELLELENDGGRSQKPGAKRPDRNQPC